MKLSHTSRATSAVFDDPNLVSAGGLVPVLALLSQLLRSSVMVATDEDGSAGYALLDVDDTIIEVHGHAKQGAGFGYSGVRGLNALLSTLTIADARRRR